MSLKNYIPPYIYITLNNLFPDRFNMSNVLIPDKTERDKTIEMITFHGFTDEELYNKFYEIYKNDEANNEMKVYITGEGSNHHDTSGIGELIVFIIGFCFAFAFYLIYEKILKNMANSNFMMKRFV